MKVNKEALSEILSPKASCRLADCLPASHNLEILADVGGIGGGERQWKSTVTRGGMKMENGTHTGDAGRAKKMCVRLCVCVRVSESCFWTSVYLCELGNVFVCVGVKLEGVAACRIFACLFTLDES